MRDFASKAAVFCVLTRFKRASPAFLGSLSLANYSEFGLIVASIGAANGWIGKDWLIVIAISMSITFVLAAPLNAFAHNIYARFSDLLKRFETETRLKEDEPIHTGEAEVGVIGMGGVGTAAYDEMQRRSAGFHIYFYKNYGVQQAQVDEKAQSATHSGG